MISLTVRLGCLWDAMQTSCGHLLQAYSLRRVVQSHDHLS